ncbi:MAG TPA: class I SAM-dependent methyltransferase [Solirubrobacteraceae bacterium]|nr:class I SAM-dependent methyltransferase [Solirubrobacteraceae bacterium]
MADDPSQVFARARGPLPRLAEPFSRRARARRLQRFRAHAGIGPGTRIVDIGSGSRGLIALAPDLDITGVDLAPRPDYPGRFVQADASEGLPFADDAFDLAYCSSVIEHVPPQRRAAFAAEVRRVARGWYVQTPAVSFPIEPHALLPGAHWLPRRLRRLYWRLGAGSDVDEINLLPRHELEALFGPARRERFGPLTKSWIALRRPGDPAATAAPAEAGSEPYEPDNFLDRRTPRSTLDAFYAHEMAREAAIVRDRLPLAGGDVLSVGCGWHPGRHLFPAPAFRLVGVDADPTRVAGVLSTGRADAAQVGWAGRLELPAHSFDVVLYRLVLHHLAYHGPLDAIFTEAARLLRPGGALVCVEPGLWHPVGLGLAAANRLGLGVAAHGTPDDVPLSPRVLVAGAAAAGLAPELYGVTYAWRRMGPRLQRLTARLDAAGDRPGAARLAHTLMLIARAPA